MNYREPDLEDDDWDDYRKYEAEELSHIKRIRNLEEEVSTLYWLLGRLWDDVMYDPENLPDIPCSTSSDQSKGWGNPPLLWGKGE